MKDLLIEFRDDCYTHPRIFRDVTKFYQKEDLRGVYLLECSEGKFTLMDIKAIKEVKKQKDKE